MKKLESINLKHIPLIKLISAALFLVGGILTYILAGSPQTMLFQIGGVPFNLIAAIFPILSGIVLLIYAFLTYYDVDLTFKENIMKIKSKKNEIALSYEDLIAVRIRVAGKFIIWFVFFFINFFFVYYGIECVLYFSANHNAGLLEYSFFSILIIWIAGLLLVLFPRKLLVIMTKEKKVIQKIAYSPKNQVFERIMDQIFGFDDFNEIPYRESNHFLYRLILGVATLLIFIITSILVEIDGIVQALHDLGIFIPIFLLLFSVLMISSALTTPLKQQVIIQENKIRIEESTLISFLFGNNFSWIRAKNPINKEKHIVKNFRKLPIYQYLLIFVLFGQATFLALKIFWLPLVYLEYFDWWDFFIGIGILIILYFFSFEIIHHLHINTESEFEFVRDHLIFNANGRNETQNRDIGFKARILQYFRDYKEALENNESNHLLKVMISYITAILVITFSYVFAGFVFFIFI